MVSAATFDLLGSGIQTIFGGVGAASAAKSYGKAATIAHQNAAIAQESTQIQLTQAQRQIYQTIGAQKAAVGGAGFASSGSNLDLLRSSVSQGALQKQVIQTQGLINENGYEAQAAAYEGQAAQSKAAAGGGILGGILKVASAFLPFSDAEAKRNIRLVGPSHIPGINLYLFQYKGDETVFSGVLAQEVLTVRPDAVEETGGFLTVDYGKLGLKMETIGA